MDRKWLEWAKRLQAIAQNGLTYSRDHFDIERYEQVREIAAEIMATHSTLPQHVIQELLTQEVGHATPKVDVRGVVFHEGGILLVRERQDGCWTLPGGWADVNESPGEAVVREIVEESGYQTRAVKLLALYDRDRHGHPPHPFYIYKLFFLCELIGGSARQSIETDGVAFFGEHEIPELSLSRVMPAQIARFFAHAHHPEWQTDFD